MKARLLEHEGAYHLLLCTGIIKYPTPEEARHFLLHYDDPQFYDGNSTWDDDTISMSDYSGQTIAIVSDQRVLEVHNPRLYRLLLCPQEVALLTIPEYAKKHGKKPAIVRRFCLAGRIPGTTQKGSRWLIPEDAPYPIDGRTLRGSNSNITEAK